MSSASPLPEDTLTAFANTDTQRLAARMAQDVFAGTFRESASTDMAALADRMSALEQQCHNWTQAADSDDGRALRLALLISGLDQWGLAYSQAFNLTALPALTALLGALRNRLDAQAESRFQHYFARLEQIEGDAIDFKVELRRNIHLALWHAMAACESTEQARHILQPLGGMMLAVNERMPQLGWRLLADALANIQVCLLDESGAATPVGRESTQQLFESLQHALPRERYQEIMAYSAQVVMAWQQARRQAH